MKIPDLPNKSYRLYSKILFSMTISVASTIFLLSLILYMNFESIGLSLIHSFIRDSLSQISYSATFMTNTAKVLASQIYFDSNTRNLLLYSSSHDVHEIDKAIKQLSEFRNTAQYVHSIYVYDGESGEFFSDSPNIGIKDKNSFFDKEIVDILDNYSSYKRLAPIPRKIPEPLAPNNMHTNVYTFVFYDLPFSSGKLDSAVVLNISEGWLREMINSLDIDPDSNTFIINKKGQLVISNKKSNMLSDISHEKYIGAILNSQASTGYFTTNVYGIKSLVTYVSSSSLDWIFIRITPYDMIISKINSMKYKTLLIGFIILFSGLLSSLFLSKKLYRPIDNILVKVKHLETEKKNSLYFFKQEFFRNILQRETEYDIDAIQNKFNELELEMDTNGVFVVIIFKIDNYLYFSTQNSYEKRSLLKFAIIDTVSEVCSVHFKNNPVDMNEDHIVLILNSPGHDLTESRQSINELVKSIQTSVQKNLGISLSATVSSTCTNISSISPLYQRTLNASYYRLLYGHNSIIYEDEIDKPYPDAYVYPMEKEKLLEDALMLERIEQVEKIYKDIVHNALNHSFAAFNLAILYLTLAISRTTAAIEKNINIHAYFNYNIFIAELNKIEILNEIDIKFYYIFEYIISKLEERKNTKYDDLVNKIVEMILNNYADYNLSVDTIAEAVNLSPVYLGRLFKKLTSKTIAEYISNVRLEKAKELLWTTDCSIHEIVEKTGFLNNSYFCTLFKKMNGITPNEYRQKR